MKMMSVGAPLPIDKYVSVVSEVENGAVALVVVPDEQSEVGMRAIVDRNVVDAQCRSLLSLLEWDFGLIG